MFECICGKSFSSGPAFSRHKRGNEKQGYKPCEAYAEYERQEQEDAKARFLSKKKTPEVDIVYDYQADVIPDFVNIKTPILPDKGLPVAQRKYNAPDNWVENTVVLLIPTLFSEIYMNIDHPEYWNVILMNVSSWGIRVKTEGSWQVISFSEWSWSFTRYLMMGYVKQTEAPEDVIPVLSEVVRVLLDKQVETEINKALKKCLTDEFMRKTIKSKYALK